MDSSNLLLVSLFISQQLANYSNFEYTISVPFQIL